MQFHQGKEKISSLQFLPYYELSKFTTPRKYPPHLYFSQARPLVRWWYWGEKSDIIISSCDQEWFVWCFIYFVSNKNTVGKGTDIQNYISPQFFISFSANTHLLWFLLVLFFWNPFCLCNFWNTWVTKSNALANSVQIPRIRHRFGDFIPLFS